MTIVQPREIIPIFPGGQARLDSATVVQQDLRQRGLITPHMHEHPAGLRKEFVVRRLPQPDQAGLLAEHDGVLPPPGHHFGTVRRGRDG
jgi:hypothetical protein